MKNLIILKDFSKCKQNKEVGLSNSTDQTWRHNFLSPMTPQLLVMETKVITITKHSLKCDFFVKVRNTEAALS